MISVAIATYNGEKYILQQLESIMNQSLSADEVIICDDGSVDSTVNLVNTFIYNNNLQEKWRIIVNEENLGYIKNFLKAISLTSGDYVFLSDQDDIFYYNKFEEMYRILKNCKDCMLLNANYEIIDGDGKVDKSLRTYSRKKREKKLHKLSFKEWLYESSFPGFSMGFKSCIRERLKDVDIDECYGHDQLIGLLALDTNGNYEINTILSAYRVHSSNTTGGRNVVDNYSIQSRVEIKKKELDEYKKLKGLIQCNHIHNVDFEYLNLRCNELELRIQYLENKKIAPLCKLLLTARAYPLGTIIGDLIYLLMGHQ